MITAQNIVDFVWEIAPDPAFANENFFELGDARTRVAGVGVAWWITSEMLEEFARMKITLGLTHERVIYDLPEKYDWGIVPTTGELPVNRRIPRLAALHGIAIHRFHSNIDLADWGMPRALFDQLGWSAYPIDWSRGIHVVTHPPIMLKGLIQEVKTRLRLPFVRYDGNLDHLVSRIAVPWGGLCQWWTGAACAAPLGFDVVMGGDIIDGVVRLAREEGWAVIDAMHHATEMEAMRRLADKVRARFPEVPVHYFENDMPWAVM